MFTSVPNGFALIYESPLTQDSVVMNNFFDELPAQSEVYAKDVNASQNPWIYFQTSSVALITI